MLARRVRLAAVAAGCALAALIAAPAAQAHPEECLTGAATWSSVVPFSEEDFMMHATGGGCAPPSLSSASAAAAADFPAVSGSGNLKHLANIPKTGPFVGNSNLNSDLAFWGKYAFQGNYNGIQVTDISDPENPTVVSQVLCPGSQNDVSVWKGLLITSTDSSRNHAECENNTTLDASNKEAWEGIRVFDVSDPANPEYVTAVETDCGSHTHTIIPEADRLVVYVSSYNPRATHPDCQPPHDKISIVEVPLDNPEASKLLSEPVLFPDGGNPGSPLHRATEGCHDITVYPAIDLAAGACMGDGILMDISDPEKPVVIDSVRDPNFYFWHSATFSHDGTKVLFTDEKGGGSTAECDEEAGPTKGADAIYTMDAANQMTFRSYFKIPRYQAETENCVAHNGNLLPWGDRDVLVQAWYQGGVSVVDWTDPTAPKELAWWDRGPYDAAGTIAGFWSTYWYNGKIYGNEIQRGFDVFQLTGPARARTGGKVPYLNAQVQEPPIK